MKKFLLMFLASFLVFPAIAANVVKTTVPYVVRNQTDTLRLDRYELPDGPKDRPVVLFAFGGGFRDGVRDDARYLPYFEFLAEHGYVVASIDYRTTLSSFDPASGATGFVSALEGAVSAAVEDFMTATAYIAANAVEWGIDPSRIVASGSSAGAITALQCEFLFSTGSQAVAMFPDGFNYAGTVTFAGAVCAPEAPMWDRERTCPMMLFHGDADSTVPFSSVTAGGMGLYGSEAISDSLKAVGAPHELYVICGSDHSVAISPMEHNLYDILAFLREFVDGRADRITVIRQSEPGAPANYKTDFTLSDFLRSNMGE